MSRCKCDWFDGADELRNRYVSGLTREDEEEIRERFPGFLIKFPETRRRSRIFCTKCREQTDVWRRNRRDDDIYCEDLMSAAAEAKHGDVMSCPFCGARVQVIHSGRMRHQCARMYRQNNFVVLHAEPDGWLSAVGITCVLDFAGQNWGAEIQTEINRKWLFRPGCALEWRAETSFRDGCWKVFWNRAANICDPFPTAYGTYHINKYFVIGEDEFRKTEMRYCAVDLVNFSAGPYAEWEKKDGIIRYLGEYCHRPQMEMLAKIGMVDAIGALVHQDNLNRDALNWREKTSLPKFLRLSKADTKRFIKDRDLVSLGFLRAIQQTSRDGVDRIDDWFIPTFIHQHHVTADQMQRIQDHRHGRSIRQIFRYLQKQRRTIHTWIDYIEMAEQLEYDMMSDEVFFPKDYVQKHDEAAQNLQIQQNEKAVREYERRYPKMCERFSYQDGELEILVPENAGEIIREGQNQHNCVAHYAESHIKGRTIILFLRKIDEPETSLVTIEADAQEPWKLRQVYGYHNDIGKAPAEKAAVVYAPWLEKWKNWVQAGSPRENKTGGTT